MGGRVAEDLTHGRTRTKPGKASRRSRCAYHARFLYPLASASGRAQSGFPPSRLHVFTHSEREKSLFFKK